MQGQGDVRNPKIVCSHLANCPDHDVIESAVGNGWSDEVHASVFCIISIKGII